MSHDHGNPTITSSKNPTTERLSGVKNIIAVASGKGGVGKSTVAVNLALALSQQGFKVGLLDADIYGPSQHIMMGLQESNPVLDTDRKILPIKQYGINILSFGFFIKGEEAVIWRGPMISRLFQQFIDDVKWGELDYLIVDLPPGTGDIQLTLTQYLKLTGVVIVSTPQSVALADAIKGITMFRKVNVDILGLVENMSTFICPKCSHESPIFSHGGGKKQAAEMNVPFLGEVPLEEATRVASDAGVPIVVKAPESEQTKRFMSIATNLAEQVKMLKESSQSSVVAPSVKNPMAAAGGFSV